MISNIDKLTNHRFTARMFQPQNGGKHESVRYHLHDGQLDTYGPLTHKPLWL